jgi:hypothetical protein
VLDRHHVVAAVHRFAEREGAGDLDFGTDFHFGSSPKPSGSAVQRRGWPCSLA